MEKLDPQSCYCYVLPNSLNIITVKFKRLLPYLEYAGETQYGLSLAALAWRKMASRGLLSSVLSKAMFFTMYDDRVPPWVPTRPPRPVSKEKPQIRDGMSVTIYEYTVYTLYLSDKTENPFLSASFQGGWLEEWQSGASASGIPAFCHSLQNHRLEHAGASSDLVEAHKSQEYLSMVPSAFIYDNHNQSRKPLNHNFPGTFLHRKRHFCYLLVA